MGISSKLKDELIKLAKNFNLDLLVLFGSRSKNNSKVSSDYDLAFLKENMSLDEEEQLFDELDGIFKGLSFDLINLEKNDNPILRKEIFFNGICLYERRKRIFLREKEYAYFDYVDSFYLLNPSKEKFMGEL